MSEKSIYFRYFMRNLPSSLRERLFHVQPSPEKFMGHAGYTVEQGGLIIKNNILEGKSFALARFGGSEIGALNGYEKIRLGIKKTYKDGVRHAMKVNAGYYPTDDAHLTEFAKSYLSAVKDADILGEYRWHMEDYFYKKYCPKSEVINGFSIEPLLGFWTSALKGLKVLVVTSFADEVVFQYSRREKIFPSNPDILPEFTLRVLQAPMTLGDTVDNRFPSSMRYVEAMEEKIRDADFDIALIGCGCYGTLLTMYCKSIGKMAIQVGGSIQTLFGIRGARWENRDHVKKMINADWIHPNSKPAGYEKIDGGAYW